MPASFTRKPSRRLALSGLIAFAAVALPLAAGAVAPFDVDPRQDPSTRIRDTIERQLAAFNAGNTELAFRLAAPNIQRAFESPERFAAMVEKDYAPIRRSQGAVFLDLRQVRNHFVQRVRLMGADGDLVEARYMMIKVNAGDWRIAGVLLDKADFRPRIEPPPLRQPR